ncbi:hypothetical protein E8E14_006386 [Neopestalotiopsis sp. 37M]|nr:hypothetical protein E8E14_006386 [Neopestalotiopsis sp. 37M]
MPPLPLNFYAAAFTIEKKAQQQSPDSLPKTSTSGGAMISTEDRPKVRKLIYSFALLLSRVRAGYGVDSGKRSGDEVAACALRERPLAGNGPAAKEYILYAAKNSGLSDKDEDYLRAIETWVNRGHRVLQGVELADSEADLKDRDIKEQLEYLVSEHLSDRVIHYLQVLKVAKYPNAIILLSFY